MDRLRCAMLLLGLVSLLSTGCCCVQGVSSCDSGMCGTMGGGGLVSMMSSGATGDVCSSGGCGGGCDSGCDSGCGLKLPGQLTGLSSCRGACGEVYVDEWISEPPVADNCGYDCGGCGSCRQCRPLAQMLKLLWGQPYRTACDTSFMCGTCAVGCDGGCGDGGCSGGNVVDSGCNCGSSHSTYDSSTTVHHGSTTPSYPSHGTNMPQATSPYSTAPAIPLQVTPQAAPRMPSTSPTPAPRVPSVTPSSAHRLSPAAQRRAVRTASATRAPR